MLTTNGPCVTVTPALLLVEPGISHYSERSAQLEKSEYRVTRAESARTIFPTYAMFTFCVAVLSDLLGSFALRAAAQVVRGHWPKGRILILGKAPTQFDDYLYDDALAHASSEAALLSKVQHLAEDYWARRGETFSDWASGVVRIARPAAAWPVSESDPTKSPAGLFLTEDPRDWPNSVRRPYGSR